MPNQAETTIIAVFRNNTDAQAAMTDLQAAGVPRGDIYLETNNDKSSRSKTGSTEGGISGWFKSIFGDENDRERSEYENAITQGNCLLRVDVDGAEIPAVEDILNRHSPVDIRADEAAEMGSTSQATTGGASQTKAAAAARTRASGASQTRTDATAQTSAGGANQAKAIPVVKEEVQMGKRQVLRGGVRVYSRVVEEPAEESVSLREERVRVERQPVDRSATDADLAAGQEQVIEVQEFAEEPVVSKQARVVEEVRVGKDVSERTETVRDKVRHTEVKVEKTPGGTGETKTFDDSDFRTDFQKRYGAGGASYDTYLPAYRYGYDMASEPRYRGRSYHEIESDLQSDYGRRYPNSSWEKMKDAVRYGWDKVTGKARATGR